MNKAQYSVEFLLVAAFSLLMVFILINVMQEEYQSNQDSIRMGQIESIARDITYNAERIYYQGKPSKITLEIQMPDKVRNVTIKNRELTFFMETSSNIVETTTVSSINLDGNIGYKSGIHYILLEAYDTYVNITG